MDPATRGGCKTRCAGSAGEAEQTELERRALAYDDPGCPPDLFGPDEAHATERHHDHDGRYDEPPLGDKLAVDDVGGMTDRAAHSEEWRPADWIEPTYPDCDRLERDERDDR